DRDRPPDDPRLALGRDRRRRARVATAETDQDSRACARRYRGRGRARSPLNRKERTMKWVTRERPKTDRIACPWLIKNYIDPEAEFLYVPAEQVLEVAARESAHSYDAPGAQYTPRDGLCSFEVLVEEYAIEDPAVRLLARIVHGADAAEDRDATPQSRGLLAVAEGFHCSTSATTVSSSCRFRCTTRS